MAATTPDATCHAAAALSEHVLAAESRRRRKATMHCEATKLACSPPSRSSDLPPAARGQLLGHLSRRATSWTMRRTRSGRTVAVGACAPCRGQLPANHAENGAATSVMRLSFTSGAADGAWSRQPHSAWPCAHRAWLTHRVLSGALAAAQRGHSGSESESRRRRTSK